MKFHISDLDSSATRVHANPVSHAEDSFPDILCETIRCNIDEFAGEIGIHRR